MAKNEPVFEKDERRSILVALIVSAVVILAIVLALVVIKKNKNHVNTVEPVASASVEEVPTASVDDYAEFVVKNQEELDAALLAGKLNIMISNEEEQRIEIPSGDYNNTSLSIDAPFTTVENSATFSSIMIYQVSSNTWVENGIGNSFYINAPICHFIVNEGASVRTIENAQYGSTLAMEIYGNVDILICEAGNSITSIQVDGSLGELELYATTNLNLSGNSAGYTTVNIESGSTDSIFKSSIKTIEYVYAGIETEFSEGAEGSQVYIYTASERNVITNNATEEITVVPYSGDTLSLAPGDEHIEEVVEQTVDSDGDYSGDSYTSTETPTYVSSDNGTRTQSSSSSSSSGSHSSGSSNSGSSTVSSGNSSSDSVSGNNATSSTSSQTTTSNSVLDTLKNLASKLESLEKNIKTLTDDNTDMQKQLEAISATITIAGYPVTRVVADNLSSYKENLPATISAIIEKGGSETVNVTWGEPVKVTDSCYKSTGTVETKFSMSEDITPPVAYIYLINEGYQFATANYTEYKVVEVTKKEKSNDDSISGNAPRDKNNLKEIKLFEDEEETESSKKSKAGKAETETETVVVTRTVMEDLVLIVNNPTTYIGIGDVMTSKLFKDRYIFPLTNKDTMGDYKVKLYYYYFDADKKLITSLGNNYYLENSGDAVTLKKVKPEDEDDEDSDNEADSEDNDETKETNAVVNPASSEESAENSEETEELEDSEVGAYWDPGKLVYKYCVVEVEIIR